MLFLASLLAFGTLWFWLFSFVLFCIITALIENNKGFWATIVFIGTFLSLNFLSKLPLLDYIKQNPGHTLEYIGVYFAVGIAWTLIKWYFFVHNKAVKYENYKAAFLKENNAESITGPLAMKLQTTIYADYTLRRENITGKAPDPADHKRDLVRWGTYWPFSMLGTVLDDVIRKIWDYMYELLQTTYSRMSKAIFKSGEADVKLAEDYKIEQAAKRKDQEAPKLRY